MEHSAKILLLGKTGVGKSAFINYFLGKKVAKSAAGKPVTMEYFIPYEIQDGRYPIEIFDTKGLEAMRAYEQLDQIIEGIKQRNNSNNALNWFHTIFYCVSMATRFEKFEGDFIRRLKKELSQHIHIIITHCDSCKPESITNMKRKIADDLGDMENVEMFEVVCVSMKKRNGSVVEPRGREEISARVFNLLMEDVAHKLSVDYAYTLRQSLKRMASQLCTEFEDFIDETVRFRTLLDYIKDENETDSRINERMDNVFSEFEEETDRIQKQTDEQFSKILYPVAQLCASYRGVVTNSYVKSADLSFWDALDWCDIDWLGKVSENDFAAKVMPRIGKYMDENGELPDGENNSIFEMLGMIGAGIGDVFQLKKNFKRAIRELLYTNFMNQAVPPESEIQARVYEQIVRYMKSKCLIEEDAPQVVSGAIENLRDSIGGLKESVDELTEESFQM